MDVVLRFRGRMVTESDVAFIRGLIQEYPDVSRRELSRKVCQEWNWVQANGAPRDMVCRGLMLALERAGQITLPGPVDPARLLALELVPGELAKAVGQVKGYVR